MAATFSYSSIIARLSSLASSTCILFEYLKSKVLCISTEVKGRQARSMNGWPEHGTSGCGRCRPRCYFTSAFTSAGIKSESLD